MTRIYIVKVSSVCFFDLEKCYEDTLIYIFRVGCSWAISLFHITKYLSPLLHDFTEVGDPFDPERPNTYSRISPLIATYDSYLVRVEPESSLEFITKSYPFPLVSRIIPICWHERITRRTEGDPASYHWLSCDLDCRCRCSSSNRSGIIRLLFMDRTNGYEHSYRSLANQSFESTSRLSYRA